MTIDAILDDVLRREGGFVDRPDDPGGATNFGITAATLERWRGRPVSREEVATLDLAEAREILAADYVRRPGIDRFSPALQPFLVDAAVHRGPARAIRFLQGVLAAVGEDGLAADGIVGPLTLGAAEEAERRLGVWLMAALADERRRFLFLITRRRPTLGVFLRGWLARANEFDPVRGGQVRCRCP